MALVLLAGVVCFSKPQGKKQKVKIIGTVIAYAHSLTQLAKLTSVPAEEMLIVRVDKGSAMKQQSPYIKVAYRYWHTEPAVPKEFFDSRKQWHFLLVRETRCDGPLRELLETKGKTERGEKVSLPFLQRTTGAENLEIPLDTTLPCYVLRPEGFKPYEIKR